MVRVDPMVASSDDAGSLSDVVVRAIDQPARPADVALAGRTTVSGGCTLDRQRDEWGGLRRWCSASAGTRA